MMALGSQRRWLGCLALASALDVVTHETLRASGKQRGPTLEPPFFGRTAAERGCAAHCARRGAAAGGAAGAVFMQHLRKAGGTLLRSYLVNYRCERAGQRSRQTNPKAGTTRVVVQEQLAFNTYSLAAEPHAIFITCLREPVDRVISAYFFSGKWKQNDHRRLNTTARSLEAWMKEVGDASARRAWSARDAIAKRGAWPPRVRIWEEVANYYVQVFSGVAARPAEERHYLAARAALESFDVVLILEKLQTPAGRANAEALLRRVLPPTGCPPTLPEQKVNEGKLRVRETPLTAGERRAIAALNGWDSRLYADAVALSDARERGPPPCPAPEAANCTVGAHPDEPNLLDGENIMRGCHRFWRPCGGNSKKPPPPAATARAAPLSSVALSNAARPPPPAPPRRG